MRKLLVALMLVAFAATAFADVTLSGSYKVRGNYVSNLDLDDTEKEKGSYYDHDFDLWLKAQTDKNTFFKSKIEIVDEEWKVDYAGDANAGDAPNAQSTMEVERAWVGHNFGGVLVEAGLMTGAAWSYSFGNAATGKYRVKVTADAGPGKVIAFVQKNKEEAFNAAGDVVKDGEKDDDDSYAIGYKGKFGGFMVAPLFVYRVNSNDGNLDTDDAAKTMSFDLAAGGNFGAVGVEFEFDYDNVKATNSDDDYANYGIYVNVFSKVAGAKVGFVTAYGSVDETDNNVEKGYSFGDDFETMLVLGDYVTPYGGDDLAGVWANKLYASYDINEKANVNGAIAYVTSNWEDDDTKAMELDLGFDYAITKALKYSIDFGYASVNFDEDMGEDTNAMIAQHSLAISF